MASAFILGLVLIQPNLDDASQTAKKWLEACQANRESFRVGVADYSLKFALAEAKDGRPTEEFKELQTFTGRLLQNGDRKVQIMSGNMAAVKEALGRWNKKTPEGMIALHGPPNAQCAVTDGRRIATFNLAMNYCGVNDQLSKLYGIDTTPFDYGIMGINELSNFRARAEMLDKQWKVVSVSSEVREFPNGEEGDCHVEVWDELSKNKSLYSFASKKGHALVNYECTRDKTIWHRVTVKELKQGPDGGWFPIQYSRQVFSPTFDTVLQTTVTVKDLTNTEPALADMAITVPAGTPIGPENPVRPVLKLKQDRVIRVDQLQELLDECQKGLAQAAVRDREHAALLKAKYDQHAPAAAPEASYSTGHWIACGLVMTALALFAASWWVRPGTQVAHS